MIINNIENYNPQNFFEFLKEIEKNIARNQNSNNNELKRLEYLVSHLNREEKRQTNYGKLKENIQRYEKNSLKCKA